MPHIVPHRPTYEKRMPFNDLKTNDVDKGKKLIRTLPDDRGSNVYETDVNGCQKMAFVAHTKPYAALV